MNSGRRETIGQRLRRLRLERGKTLRELALAPPSFQYVSMIETGRRVPSLDIIRTLARSLGVDPVYLETGEEPAAVELARLVLSSDGRELPVRAHLLAQRVLEGG